MKKDEHITVSNGKKGKVYTVRLVYFHKGKRKFYERAFSEAKYGADAKACAIFHRNEKMAEFQAGIVPQTAPTVGDLFERKFELFPCRLKTRLQHEYFFRQAIQQYENVPIDKIKASDVQASVNRYCETHTHDMGGKLLSVWRQIFKAAQLEELNIADKTMAVVVPKDAVPVKKRNVMISDEDLKAFLDALLEYNSDNPRGRETALVYWCVLQIMYYTGMRPAEVFALQRRDIDLERKEIRISKAVGSSADKKGQIVPAKTINAIRSVPFTQALADILSDCVFGLQPDDFVFTIEGNLIDVDYFTNHIHLVSKKSGIQFHSYMLRHKFATDMQKTQSPRTVQDLLGHATFQMSVEYARSDEDERRKAIEDRKLS